MYHLVAKDFYFHTFLSSMIGGRENKDFIGYCLEISHFFVCTICDLLHFYSHSSQCIIASRIFFFSVLLKSDIDWLTFLPSSLCYLMSPSSLILNINSSLIRRYWICRICRNRNVSIFLSPHLHHDYREKKQKAPLIREKWKISFTDVNKKWNVE